MPAPPLPPASAATNCALPGAVEPIFLLERLDHIRCLSLTVCGADGGPLCQVAAAVSGSEVELQCLQTNGDATKASSATPPPTWSCIRLDVGEEIASGSAAVQLIGGYAYMRLPLAEPLTVPELDRELRCKVGFTCRAAEQRRRERALLRGAKLHCQACDAPLCRLQGDVRALPDADAAAMVDFVQCCEELVRSAD